MSARRIWALLLRHLFVWRRHWASVFDLFYWPLIDLLVFGFLAGYFASVGTRTPAALLVGMLLGALILWDLFFRVQQSISVSFLMELWSRNLLNLFTAPLSLREFVVALMLFGLVKITITAALMTAVAWFLYRFNVFTLGPALVPLALALIVFAWAVGTAVTGVLVRYGLTAENLAWTLAFIFYPFGAVFFPLTVYPAWLQPVLWWLPLPHVFEAMRAVLQGSPLPAAHLWWAFGLDALYLAGGFAFFGAMFRSALREGSILKAHT